MDDLLKTDKCSPLIAYLLLVIISGVTIYKTHQNLKKFKNYKVDNIFHLFAWYEISLLLSMGIVLLGLCQYNQQVLGWIVLSVPLVLLICKTYYVFTMVGNLSKHIPEDKKNIPMIHKQAMNPYLKETVSMSSKIMEPMQVSNNFANANAIQHNRHHHRGHQALAPTQVDAANLMNGPLNP